MVYKPTSKEKQTCFICQESFSKERLHIHNHTINHHAWIEKIKGCEQPHTCYACNVTVIGMKSYNRHFNRKNHKLNMKRLHEHKDIDYQFNVTVQEAQSYFASGKERTHVDKCYLCFYNVPIQNWHWHVHDYPHHHIMETLKRGRTHTCWACDMITHSLGDYKKHIKTPTHKNNLEQLKRTNNTREDILIFYSAEIEEFKDVTQRPKKNKNNKPQTNVPNAQCQTQSVMGSSAGAQPEQHLKPGADGEHPSQSEQKQPSLRRRAHSPGDQEASLSHLNKRVCVDVPSANVPQKASAWGQISGANAGGKDPESLRGSCRFSNITRPGHVEQKETPVTPQQSRENSSSGPRVYTHNASAQEHLTRRVCDAHESTPPEHPDQLLLQKLLEQTRSSTATQRAETEKASASEKEQKRSSTKRKKVPHTDADEDQSGQKQLDELMCLSVREEELNQALEKTSDSLFQAYAVLQKTYTHVQHLITAKQQVTSEMSSLRAKRLKILQDMKSCCGDASEVDQQAAPNSS